MDWCVDIECAIVDAFGWSLYHIDETDIESLIPFIFRFPKWKEAQPKRDGSSPKPTSIDAKDANWL